jgi:hypothetical protein
MTFGKAIEGVGTTQADTCFLISLTETCCVGYVLAYRIPVWHAEVHKNIICVTPRRKSLDIIGSILESPFNSSRFCIS